MTRVLVALLLGAALAHAEGVSSDEFHDVPEVLRKQIDASIESGLRFLTNAAKNGEFPSLIEKSSSQGGQHMLIRCA